MGLAFGCNGRSYSDEETVDSLRIGSLGADWSKLPADILSSIQGELEFSDLFRSAAVFPSWRAAATASTRGPRPPASSTPPPRPAPAPPSSDRTTYTIPLPDPPVAERSVVGSSHGWLVMADARSVLHLLNPATGDSEQVLPPVATVEQVSPVLDDAGDLQRYDLSFYDTNLPRKENQPPQPYAADRLRRACS